MRKIEGYWYSENCPQYPMPIKDELTPRQAYDIYTLILVKQSESKIVVYRGLSRSRITGQLLGGIEYEHPSGWVWPGDFAKHYVFDHGVKPTDEFLNFLNYTI